MSDRDPDPLDLEAEGIPAIEDRPEGVDDPVEGMVPPRDHPVAAEGGQATVGGQLRGEALGQRVAHEEPEGEPGGGDTAARLVQPDQGVPGFDAEPSEVAGEAAGETGGLSAEEAAVQHTDAP